MKLALTPRPRLLAALLVGSGLMVVAAFLPPLWLVVAAYHAVLLTLVVREGLMLPSKNGFQVVRRIPQPFSLGLTQAITVAVDNPVAAHLRAQVSDHAPWELRPQPRVVATAFDAEGHLEISYTARPPTRGSFLFGRVDLRCWRPGGWWIKQVGLPLEERGAVYPNVVAVRQYQLTLRRRMPMRSGLRRARPPGATTAFAGLREYLPGDEIRRVNWKATARRDLPVVNEVEAERGQQVLIALDCGRLMTAPSGELSKLDHAVNAALLLGWVAQHQGDRVGMVSFSDQVDHFLTPRRGVGQMNLLNEMLYSLRPQYIEPDFGAAFARISHRLGRRSLVIVLTDIMDASSSRELVTQALWLAHRHLVMVVTMTDPALMGARDAPIDSTGRAYEWAAAEELLAARRQSFEQLRHGGVLSMDVLAGTLSPALVERYLELKERALV